MITSGCDRIGFPVPRTKLNATRAYLVDWRNAFRLLWHVFVISRSRRRPNRALDAARPAFRDVTKFGKYYWYFPAAAFGPLLCA